MDPATSEIWEGGGRRFHVEKVVGNGAFGIVWRAVEEGGDGSLYAIKKVVLDRRYHNRELEMMKGLDHPCVIKLHHHFEKAGKKRDETYLHLVMDFLPETIRSASLAQHKARSRLPIDQVRAYMQQTFRALEYIHSKSVCHRDLKPDNLLVDPPNLRLKLIDFGCAKVLVKGQPNVSYICSRYYRAPELLFGATEYSCAVDQWSAGTILVELLLGHLPFQGQDSTQQHIIEIMKLLGTPNDKELRAMRATCTANDLPKLKAYPWERVFPSGTPSRAINLALKLLTYDPSARLSASAALAHPFFEGVEAILEGKAAPPTLEPSEAWQKSLRGGFEEYVSARSERVLALLPKFEASVQQMASGGTAVRSIFEEVEELMRGYQRAEEGSMRQLTNTILSSVRGGAAHSPGLSEKQQQLKNLMEGGGAEPLVMEAARAQKENDALRTQLHELLNEKRASGSCLESLTQKEDPKLSLSTRRRQSDTTNMNEETSPLLSLHSSAIDAEAEGVH